MLSIVTTTAGDLIRHVNEEHTFAFLEQSQTGIIFILVSIIASITFFFKFRACFIVIITDSNISYHGYTFWEWRAIWHIILMGRASFRDWAAKPTGVTIYLQAPI